jgi:transposase-like protein
MVAAIEAVAAKLGVGTVETLRNWIGNAEVDAGGIDPSVGSVGDAYDNALAGAGKGASSRPSEGR